MRHRRPASGSQRASQSLQCSCIESIEKLDKATAVKFLIAETQFSLPFIVEVHLRILFFKPCLHVA